MQKERLESVVRAAAAGVLPLLVQKYLLTGTKVQILRRSGSSQWCAQQQQMCDLLALLVQKYKY